LKKSKLVQAEEYRHDWLVGWSGSRNTVLVRFSARL